MRIKQTDDPLVSLEQLITQLFAYIVVFLQAMIVFISALESFMEEDE